MESQRVILFFAFCLLSFMLWDSWHKEFSPHPTVKTEERPTSLQNEISDVPVAHSSVTQHQEKINTNENLNNVINIKTDVLDLVINKTGGDIISSKLLQYPVSLSDKKPLQLLNYSNKDLYLAPNGLVSDIGPDTVKNRAEYNSKQNSYELTDNKDNILVPLTWSKNGIIIEKVFKFKRGSYEVDVEYNIKNNSGKSWEGYPFARLKRKEVPVKSSALGFKTFTGLAWYTPDSKYKTFAFDKLKSDPQSTNAKNGWIAMVQQYFVSAWIPEKDQEYNIKLNTLSDNIYAGTLTGPEVKLAPGESKQISFKFYSGPEIPAKLNAVAPHLDRSIDFGIFWPISSVLLSIMKFFHKFLLNWGLAIIAVTVLIKALFYKMSASSYRSMAKMKKLQPKIDQIKQRYGEDKQKVGVAMMELYKKEKVSPLGGCLPMLIQMPFFLGFYWAIIESVQLRQAPFFLWIKDLSIPDPYFVLPIIMGVTMLLQQKLSPQSYQDETQAKVMMIMPVVFTFMFLYFPAGLVLYWTVNNALSILQQWWVMKQEGV